jgi:hypothetical protein
VEDAQVKNILVVHGWNAISAKDAILPEVLYVTLEDKNKNIFYMKAQHTARPDVAYHFHQPTMMNAGFTTYADISHLKGKFKLGITRLFHNRMEVCDQFQMPIVIG